MHRERTTASCLLLATLAAGTVSPSGLTAPLDARATLQASGMAQSFPSETLWTVDISATPVGSPAAAGDRVFVPLQSGIEARHLRDGRTIWSRKLELGGALAASPDRVVAPTARDVRVLDAASGTEVWTVPVGPLTAPPLVTGDVVILAANDQLAGYSAADGTVRWTREVGRVEHRPAIAGTRLYVPVSDGRLLALELASGEPVWEADLGIGPTEPLVDEDRLFVGTSDKSFFSLALKTGKENWRQRVAAAVIGPPAVDAQHVYVVALDNLLRAFDRRNGARRWQKDLKYRPSAGPIVVGATVGGPGRFQRLQTFDAAKGADGAPLALTDPIVGVPVFIPAEPPGLPRLVAISGGLKGQWKLTALIAPPPAPPRLPVGPVTVLPGPVVPRGTLTVPPG